MKKYSLLFALVLSFGIVFGQSASEGLIMSSDDVLGTARYTSMAGAFGALGGDYSAQIQNPAGLGIYRSSEFAISLGLDYKLNSLKYNGVNTDLKSRNTGINHLNLVWAGNTGRESGLLYTNFSIGYTKLADYNNYFSFTDVSAENSLSGILAENANGINYNSLAGDGTLNNYTTLGSEYWESILAWQTTLLDTMPGENSLYAPAYIDGSGDVLTKVYELSSSGSKNEYNIAYSVNYNNKVFVGGSMGIQSLNYVKQWRYFEDNPDLSATSPLLFMDYIKQSEISGMGVNAKLGFIIKPINAVRIAGSIHAPTVYRIRNVYSYRMNVETLDYGWYDYSTPTGEYNYSYSTPLKMMLSTAIILGKTGLLSVDYEYVDFSTMRYSKGDFGDNLEDLNIDVRSMYKPVHNFRVGGEFRYGLLALRGGYAFSGDPYKDSRDMSSQMFAGGIGYKYQSLSFDVAYSYKIFKEQNDMVYSDYSQPFGAYNYNSTNSQIVFTLGFRF